LVTADKNKLTYLTWCYDELQNDECIIGNSVLVGQNKNFLNRKVASFYQTKLISYASLALLLCVLCGVVCRYVRLNGCQMLKISDDLMIQRVAGLFK